MEAKKPKEPKKVKIYSAETSDGRAVKNLRRFENGGWVGFVDGVTPSLN